MEPKPRELDHAYEDKLDGKITTAYFDQRAAEWNSEQTQLLRRIEEHQLAKKNYLEEGILLLELATTAYQLYKRRDPAECASSSISYFRTAPGRTGS